MADRGGRKSKKKGPNVGLWKRQRLDNNALEDSRQQPADTVEELSKRFSQMDENGVTAIAKECENKELHDAVANIMKLLMTDSLTRQFSWTGDRGRKMKFKDSDCHTFVQKILKKTRSFRDEKESEVQDALSRFLGSTKDLTGRRSLRRHQRKDASVAKNDSLKPTIAKLKKGSQTTKSDRESTSEDAGVKPSDKHGSSIFSKDSSKPTGEKLMKVNQIRGSQENVPSKIGKMDLPGQDRDVAEGSHTLSQNPTQQSQAGSSFASKRTDHQAKGIPTEDTTSALAAGMTGGGIMNISGQATVNISSETFHEEKHSKRQRKKKRKRRRTSDSDDQDPEDWSQVRCKHGTSCNRLRNSICYFPDVKLSSGKNSCKVYAGVKTSSFGEELLAIKLIWDFVEKNKREARNLLTLLPHQNVVNVIDAGLHPNSPLKCMYIAMARCNPVTLESYINDRKEKIIPFNVHQAIEYTKQTVEAIHHMHTNGILHRDLKPSSILISLDGRTIKLCDFGLSKQLQKGRSVTNLSTLKIDTDGYRAPEIYNKDKISKMADIYSLALVLYYLLSYGFHPFGLDPYLWVHKISKNEAYDLSHLRIPFREIARSLLEKMLPFDSKQRLSITKVRNDQLMKSDWFKSLLDTLVEVWSGTIKDEDGSDVLACQLFRSLASEHPVKMNGSGWSFQMLKENPFFDLGPFKKVLDEEPSGYVVASSKDEFEKIMEKLGKSNQMAWIDIFKKGEENKVLVFLCHKDHPELFGIFLPHLEIVRTVLAKLQTKAPTRTRMARTERSDEESSSTESTASRSSLAVQSSQGSNRRQGASATVPNQEYPERSGEESSSTESTSSGSNRQQKASDRVPNWEYPDPIPYWVLTEDVLQRVEFFSGNPK